MWCLSSNRNVLIPKKVSPGKNTCEENHIGKYYILWYEIEPSNKTTINCMGILPKLLKNWSLT